MNCTLDTDAQCEALEVCYNHTTSNPLKPCTLNNLEIRGRLRGNVSRLDIEHHGGRVDGE